MTGPSTDALCPKPPLRTDTDELRREVLGFVEDRVRAADADEVVVVLDGGPDSAVVATLLVEALGSDRVTGLLLPCNLSTEASALDAETVADALDIDRARIHLHPLFEAFRDSVMPAFDVRGEYVPQDVVISRLRMTCAYFIAATTGRLVAADTTRTRHLLPAPGDPGADVADIQPVGHLYATEVAALGRSLGVPAMILDGPAAGTPLAERYDAVSADLSPATVDRALAAVVDRGEDPEAVARALDADPAAVATLVRAVERRRREHSVLDRA